MATTMVEQRAAPVADGALLGTYRPAPPVFVRGEGVRVYDDAGRAYLDFVAGIGVNAGHDLTVANLPALAKAIPDLAEVSIGHGLTADALEFGMAKTVERFLAACGW